MKLLKIQGKLHAEIYVCLFQYRKSKVTTDSQRPLRSIEGVRKLLE